MRCDYKDDFKVEYSGSLHITKGDGVDITVSAGQIPASIRSNLDSAVIHNSCHELRAASRALTDSLNEEWQKE